MDMFLVKDKSRIASDKYSELVGAIYSIENPDLRQKLSGLLTEYRNANHEYVMELLK